MGHCGSAAAAFSRTIEIRFLTIVNLPSVIRTVCSMIQQLHPCGFETWCDASRTDADGMLPVVLDVREPWELQTASVTPAGFTLVHLPMREVPAGLAALQETPGANHPIACLCHHGTRSLQVAGFLAQQGFTNVVNLQGGIDAWSTQLDARVPRY